MSTSISCVSAAFAVQADSHPDILSLEPHLMKNLFAALLLSAVVIESSAAPVTFEFSAVISSLNYTNYDTGDQLSLSASSVPGASVAIGDIFTGSLTYETNAAIPSHFPWIPKHDPELAYGFPVKMGSATYVNERHDIVFNTDKGPNQSSMYVTVINAAPGSGRSDKVSFSPGSEYVQDEYHHFSFNFYDRQALALSDLALPTDFNLSAFNDNTMVMFWHTGPESLYAQASVTHFSLLSTSPVPEPTTGLMLLMGLGLVACTHKARRKC